MLWLEVKNPNVEIDRKKILNGLNLTIEKGKVHAIMGPNGSGKSTLAYVLAGKTDYQVTAGEVLFDGEDLLAMQPDERAARGVFLAFQYPMEIPGVAVRAGTHCVMPLLARYGVTATCRASFALYNTKDEVDTLAESMVKAREFLMSDDTPTVEKPAEGAQPAPAGKPSALPEAEIARLTDEIVTALKTVYDPEIPADIYEIGLIYRIDIADDRTVKVDMSLTSPNCPSAQELPVMVQDAVSTVPGVGKVDVSVVWDPPWDPSRMSEEARVVLNMF